MRFSHRKNFGPLFITLLGLVLGLAACKLTTSGTGLTTPTGGSGEYLFATSNNQLWSFSINATTGALGTPASVTGAAFSPAVVGNPAGTFLYAMDAVNDQVDAYAISSSGTLSASGSPYSLGGPGGVYTPGGLAMDSAGKYLFAADPSNNAVAGFTVNSTSGALTTASNSPFSASGEPAQVVVDASGQFVYAADFSSVVGGVSAFTLSSGALTPVPGYSPFNIVATGGALGLATTGQYVYVTEQNANVVVAMSINSGGGLSIIGTAAATGSEPTGVVLTPSAKYLYVANYGDSTISAYSVNSTTGALMPLTNSPFAATAAPYYLAVDPSGSFLYATNPADNSITGFTITSSSGALTPFSGTATAVGTQPVSLTVVTVP